MTPVVAVVVALLFAAATLASAYAWRSGSQLRAVSLALRLVREREAAFINGARQLALAARGGVDHVRTHIDRAIREMAPSVDTVLIFDEEDAATLACVAASGTRAMYFAGTRVARADADALPCRALTAGHRVTLADAATRSFHPADIFALAVPVPHLDGRRSVIHVASPQRIDSATLDALVTLIEHAGFSYALAHERDADRRRAEFDGLTGLLTPRAFRDRLAALVDRARYVPRARIALLFIDTDRFKLWNDTFGHTSGDALLRALARTLRRATASDDDLVARNGGDEFCIVFTDTEKSRAVERAETLRECIAAIDFSALHGNAAAGNVAITASIGVAAYPADAAGAHELLERADAAMYHSKRTGRNAVSFYGVDGTAVRAEATAAAT